MNIAEPVMLSSLVVQERVFVGSIQPSKAMYSRKKRPLTVESYYF